jgi:hypothetical protein
MIVGSINYAIRTANRDRQLVTGLPETTVQGLTNHISLLEHKRQSDLYWFGPS